MNILHNKNQYRYSGQHRNSSDTCYGPDSRGGYTLSGSIGIDRSSGKWFQGH